MRLINTDKIKAGIKRLKSRWFPPKIRAWVARDYDGSIWVYDGEPVKISNENYGKGWDCIQLDHELFPEVTWEDEKPTEVELLIKKK